MGRLVRVAAGALAALALLAVGASWGGGRRVRAACGTGRTFYVDARSGNDRNCGTSPAQAWRTIRPVNGTRLPNGSTVLFRGRERVRWGPRPRDRFLRTQSGVRYASYGGGRAVFVPAHGYDAGPYRTEIFLCSVHDVEIDGFVLEGGSARANKATAIAAGEAGSHCGATRRVRIIGAQIRSWQEGIQAGYNDGDWTIDRVLIDHIAGNGILFDRHDGDRVYGGTRLNVLYSTIEHTGEDPPGDYGVHGIYDNAADSQIIGNTIRWFQSDGVSIRFHDATLTDNVIADGAIGIGAFAESRSGGTTRIIGNRIFRTSEGAIFVCGPREGCRLSPEHFVIYGNVLGRGAGLNLQPTAAGYSLSIKASRPR